MEQNLVNKIELKDKLITFYKSNKLKIYSLLVFTLFIVISILLLNLHYEKKNNIIAEKYIKAGLYLTSGEKNKTRDLYEEIIMSKNKFYSILALNSILEKNLETNEEKILNYFKTVESLKISLEQKQILIFKKAVYLIKIAKVQDGNNILKKIIESNSSLSSLAKEVLIK